MPTRLIECLLVVEQCNAILCSKLISHCLPRQLHEYFFTDKVILREAADVLGLAGLLRKIDTMSLCPGVVDARLQDSVLLSEEHAAYWREITHTGMN